MTALITRDELPRRDRPGRGHASSMRCPRWRTTTSSTCPVRWTAAVDEARDRAAEVLPDKDAAIVAYCSNKPDSEGVTRI